MYYHEYHFNKTKYNLTTYINVCKLIEVHKILFASKVIEPTIK